MKKINLYGGYTTLLDDEDYEKFCNYKYNVDMKGYAKRHCLNSQGKRSTIFLHREIMNAPRHLVVDHINHDKLDNRKSNLRLVTNQQNRFNSNKPSHAKTSQYKGVSWRKEAKLWITVISINGKEKIIGRFESEETAAVAYNVFAEKHFGEYALLNDVPFDPEWESKKILNRVRGSGSSKYTGVSIRKNGDWIATITFNGKQKHIGLFKDEIEAAKAYNEAALKYHKEKAKLNTFD